MSDSRRPLVLGVLAVVVTLGLIVLGVIYLAPEWAGGGPPFQQDQVAPRVEGLRVLPSDERRQIARVMAQLGGTSNDLPASLEHGSQVVTGVIDVGGHAAPPGTLYQLVVVDNRQHAAAQLVPANRAGSGPAVSRGHGPALMGALAKYDFLHVVNAATAQSLSFAPSAKPLHVPFLAVLPRGAAPATVSQGDVTVALVLTGPTFEDWWAAHWT